MAKIITPGNDGGTNGIADELTLVDKQGRAVLKEDKDGNITFDDRFGTRTDVKQRGPGERFKVEEIEDDEGNATTRISKVKQEKGKGQKAR